jgi:hypothetical protein
VLNAGKLKKGCCVSLAFCLGRVALGFDFLGAGEPRRGRGHEIISCAGAAYIMTKVWRSDIKRMNGDFDIVIMIFTIVPLACLFLPVANECLYCRTASLRSKHMRMRERSLKPFGLHLIIP